MIKVLAFISLFLFSIQSTSATSAGIAMDKYAKSGRKMAWQSANFGNKPPNSSSTETITLTNTWTMPLEVKKVDPANSSLSPEFWHYMPRTNGSWDG